MYLHIYRLTVRHISVYTFLHFILSSFVFYTIITFNVFINFSTNFQMEIVIMAMKLSKFFFSFNF